MAFEIFYFEPANALNTRRTLWSLLFILKEAVDRVCRWTRPQKGISNNFLFQFCLGVLMEGGSSPGVCERSLCGERSLSGKPLPPPTQGAGLSFENQVGENTRALKKCVLFLLN